MAQLQKLLEQAEQCKTYKQSDDFLKSIESNDNISDAQRYIIKEVSLHAAHTARRQEVRISLY